jgi:hypothetical protein
MQNTPVEDLTQTLIDSIQIQRLLSEIERDQKKVDEKIAQLQAIREKYNEENQMLFI